MTDNEIIKALECWIKNFDGKVTDYINLCNALDLINRQKAELENYSHNVKGLTKSILKYQKLLKKAKEDIKSLDKLNIDASRTITDLFDSNQELETKLKTAKAKAYKEFAERLKEKTNWLFSTVSINKEIDNLLKEMVGEDK